MNNLIFTITFVLIIMASLYLDVTTPYVRMTSSYECVSVEYPDGTTGSCNALPDKYNTTFVASN